MLGISSYKINKHNHFGEMVFPNISYSMNIFTWHHLCPVSYFSIVLDVKSFNQKNLIQIHTDFCELKCWDVKIWGFWQTVQNVSLGLQLVRSMTVFVHILFWSGRKIWWKRRSFFFPLVAFPELKNMIKILNAKPTLKTKNTISSEYYRSSNVAHAYCQYLQQ